MFNDHSMATIAGNLAGQLRVAGRRHSLVWENGWHEGGGAVERVSRCRCGVQGTDPRIWDCVRAVEAKSG